MSVFLRESIRRSQRCLLYQITTLSLRCKFYALLRSISVHVRPPAALVRVQTRCLRVVQFAKISQMDEHLEVVQFVHQQRAEGCSGRAPSGAVENGDLGMLQYLYKHGSKSWSEVFFTSVFLNRPHYRLHCRLSTDEQKLRIDHVGGAQFLHERRVEIPSCCFTIDDAVKVGDLDVIKCIHKNCSTGHTRGWCWRRRWSVDEGDGPGTRAGLS